MPPSEPTVVKVLRDFKSGLAIRETSQLMEMARRWMQIEQALTQEMDTLAAELVAIREAGQEITQWHLFRMDRYRSLIAQAQIQVERYNREYAEVMIRREEAEYYLMGKDHAEQAMRAAAMDANIRADFKRLPVGTLENAIAYASEGSPLRALLKKSWPATEDGIARAIITGVAAGHNPREIALDMKRGFGVGLERARLIATDQQNRFYRSATDDTYRASGVVMQKRRLASKSERTCLACLALDGESMAIETDMWDHARGRCSTVPVLSDAPPLKWQTGGEWFKGLPETQQKKMMDMESSRLFPAWKAGLFKFEDLAAITHNKTWGRGLRVRSAKELLKRHAPPPGAAPVKRVRVPAAERVRLSVSGRPVGRPRKVVAALPTAKVATEQAITRKMLQDSGKFDPKLSESQRDRLTEVLIKSNMTVKDLERVSVISTELPGFIVASGKYTMGKYSYVDPTKGPMVLIEGMYAVGPKSLHIHPSVLGGSRASYIISHELGHAAEPLTFAGKNFVRREFERASEKLVGYSASGAKTFNHAIALKAGLRDYSFTSASEFFAEVSMVNKIGSEGNKAALEDMLGMKLSAFLGKAAVPAVPIPRPASMGPSTKVPAKRGPGRPRKVPSPVGEPVVKRGKGRPRKYPLAAKPAPELGVPVKRGKGRPRKIAAAPVPVTAVKRPPGRPKKATVPPTIIRTPIVVKEPVIAREPVVPKAPAGSVIPKPPADNVSMAEELANRDIEKTASDYRTTTDKVREKVTQTLQELVDKGDISIRTTPNSMLGILHDGRFKSQFETRGSGGFYSPSLRRQAEQSGLGYSEKTPPRQRPIYGVVANELTNGAEYHYGTVQIVLKSSVKDRSTITVDDSLSHFVGEEAYASPARSVHWRSADGWAGNVYSKKMKPISYVEAQIHGGVSTKDIAKIVIHGDLPDHVLLQLRESQIPYEFI